MSPDSASCSTRAGSGVCGRRLALGVGLVARPAPRRAPAPARGPRPCAGAGAPGPPGPGCRRAGRPRSSSSAITPTPPPRPAALAASAVDSSASASPSSAACRLRPRSLSRSGAEPGGHLVERGRGHDEQAEEREQHEQGYDDELAAQQVHEQARDHEADGAAGLLEGLGVAALRHRQAVGDVDQAEHPEQQRRPADHLTTGGTVALGVAQVAPGHEAQQQRDEPAEQPDRAVDDGADRVADSPGQLPPDRGGDDHGETRPGAAPRRRGGARGRARERCARPCARAAPSTWATASHKVAVACQRPSPSRATGPVPLRTARGAGRDRARPLPRPFLWAGFAAVFRAAVFPRGLEPDLVPDLPDFDCPPARDDGGEDVRVAMLTNLRDRHTSHTLHTRGAPPDLPRPGPAGPDQDLETSIESEQLHIPREYLDRLQTVIPERSSSWGSCARRAPCPAQSRV